MYSPGSCFGTFTNTTLYKYVHADKFPCGGRAFYVRGADLVRLGCESWLILNPDSEVSTDVWAGLDQAQSNNPGWSSYALGRATSMCVSTHFVQLWGFRVGVSLYVYNYVTCQEMSETTQNQSEELKLSCTVAIHGPILSYTLHFKCLRTTEYKL